MAGHGRAGVSTGRKEIARCFMVKGGRMKALRVVGLWVALVLGMASSAMAEGFALTEWSARGLGLASGMVGRADDVSAIAYNAAGITQLPGVQVMGGMGLIAPMGTLSLDTTYGKQETTTKPAVWAMPHAYASWQLNDSLWLGLGVFSRFGLGNSYDQNWTGRYNLYSVNLQTISAVPTLAWKINDILSVSAGLEIMNINLTTEQKFAPFGMNPMGIGDHDAEVQGSGWGVGGHFGLHARLNDQWSIGLAYKTQVTANVYGDAKYGGILKDKGMLKDCDAHGTVQLPDSLALGVAYKPLDNLSFEVGAVWTRWSTYNSLNIYMDNGNQSISHKNWNDGWNFNASVEYKPLDWWSLRAGFWYETPVINEDHSDFMVPSNGRTALTLGTGVEWNDFTVDFAYCHMWINPTSYDKTDGHGILDSGYITGGTSKDTVANIYMLSFGYKF